MTNVPAPAQSGSDDGDLMLCAASAAAGGPYNRGRPVPWNTSQPLTADPMERIEAMAENNVTTLAPVTSKQFGDAGEHRVMSDLTFNDIPTAKMPDNWPGFDVIAFLPPDRTPVRISVKARRQKTVKGDVKMRTGGDWDWLAIVLIPLGGGTPRTWYIPREVVMANSVPVSRPRICPTGA